MDFGVKVIDFGVKAMDFGVKGLEIAPALSLPPPTPRLSTRPADPNLAAPMVPVHFIGETEHEQGKEKQNTVEHCSSGDQARKKLPPMASVSIEVRLVSWRVSCFPLYCLIL